MIYDFLKTHDISYQRVDHPAVFSCEEARKLVPPLPGAETKNLFLRDDKGRRHFLVSVSSEKSVHLRELSVLLGTKGLGFASSERLRQHLGVEPGSVTLLAVINDSAQAVEVVIDSDIWSSEIIQCHPLINTSTLLLSKNDMAKFLELTNHPPRIVSVPSK